MTKQPFHPNNLFSIVTITTIAVILLMLVSKTNWPNYRFSSSRQTTPTPTLITPTLIPPPAGSQTISYIQNGDIWTSSDIGNHLKQITHDGHVADYIWLKNPRGLIFDSISGDNTKTIAAIKKLNLNTNVETTIFSRTTRVELAGGISPRYTYTLSISPDEHILAYDGAFLSDSSQMAIEDLTSGQVRYTHTVGHVIFPDSGIIFSPDSQYLVEVSFIGSDYNLKLLSLKDLSLRPLTTKYISPYDQNPKLYGDFKHPYSAVAWSPDGKKFLYYLSNYGAGGLHQSQQLYQFDLNSMTETTATPPTPDSIQNFLYQTPDGHEIYYDVSSGYVSRTLKKTNFMTNQTTIFSLPNEVTHLQVSPQGEPIMFEMQGIWSMNTDGSNVHLINKDAINPKWVPK